VTFSFIEQHRDTWPVTVMCDTLGVSPQGFYAWRCRPASDRQRRRDAILVEIRAVHAEVKQRYGSPRIHAELSARGIDCCVNTVAKLMRGNDIHAKTARKFKSTTDSIHPLPVADNHLAREFDPAEPDRAWAADITYIPTGEGWLYLAVVEDLFNRMIVGWSMADHMESRLVVDALDMAVARRRPGSRLIAHSDRGSQYASAHYQEVLAAAGIVCSMSEVGQCWDNAPVESFFGRLKCELAPDRMFATRDQARAALFEYLEVFYNRVRRHSSLGFVSPAEFERTYHLSHR